MAPSASGVDLSTLRDQLEQAEAGDWDVTEAQSLAEELQALSARVKQAAEAKMTGPISEEETTALAAAKEQIDAETAEGECTFWFVAVAVILCNTEAKTLPSFTELSQREGALVKQKISRGEAFRGVHRDELCAISHRWEAPETPDGLGVQMKALREHLKERPQIKYVWYDFWVRAPPADLSLPVCALLSEAAALSLSPHRSACRRTAGAPPRRRPTRGPIRAARRRRPSSYTCSRM